MFGGFSDFFGGGSPFDGMVQRSRRPTGPKTFKLYDLLGVDKDVSGSKLTKAFHLKSRKGEYRHPDKGGDPEKFSELQAAYQRLRNKSQRAEYDKYGDACLAEDFVGTPKRKLRQAKTKSFPLPVTLEQLFNGDTRKIAVTRRVLVNRLTGEYCEGDGQDLWCTCDRCGGRGFVMKKMQPQPGYVIQTQAACPKCEGSGVSLDEDWKLGQKKEVLEVYIEKGMKNGSKIRFREKGNMSPGFLPGDIVVVLKTKTHSRFQRKNADLLMRKRLSMDEALCGFEFTIKHLDGRELVIKSRPGEIVENNCLKMLKDEGFPLQHDTFSRGSLFVNFIVEMPPLSATQRSNIRKILTGSPNLQLCTRTEEKEVKNLEKTRKEQFGKTKYAYHDDGAYNEDDSDEEENEGGAQRCRVQ